MKPKKQPPAFRIEFDAWDALDGKLRYVFRVKARNGLTILSSTSQGYARLIDARKVAKNFVVACKAGRVVVEESV